MKKSSVSVDTLQVLDEEALAQVVGGRRDYHDDYRHDRRRRRHCYWRHGRRHCYYR